MVVRIDSRTEDMHRRLFVGINGTPAIATQVALHEQRLDGIAQRMNGMNSNAERSGARAGAQWGGLIGTAIAAVGATFWAIVNAGKQ